MRFDVSPAVRCSGVLRCCLTVLVVLWAGLAGLQGVVASSDGLNLDERIQQDDLEALEGRLVIRFSSSTMAGLDSVAGETVKTISAALSHRMITDLSDSSMDDLFVLNDSTRLSMVAPLILQGTDERHAMINANLMIQNTGQDSVMELPLLMDGQLDVDKNQSYVFTVSAVSIPVTWALGQKTAEIGGRKQSATWRGEDGIERTVVWRGRESRNFVGGMPAHPMPYHSPQQLHIPFTPIPKPPLPKSSPLPEPQGVFPEDSKQSPFSSSPKLDKPADKPEFNSDGVSFPSQHSPFS
ncbi:hypothetical protein [Kistimonas asteriae]|uniref:hypothetical protein n=1 Tax=Kistimonas asteriae TaxID=517724 RepID=UPI001BAB9C72|nr:hypothetical protein [Kistimonas asteriae]